MGGNVASSEDATGGNAVSRRADSTNVGSSNLGNPSSRCTTGSEKTASGNSVSGHADSDVAHSSSGKAATWAAFLFIAASRGPGITIFFSTHPNDTLDADQRGELLLKRTEDLGRTFSTVSSNMFSFGYIGRFLITSIVKKQFYSVLEADDDMIFMHVDEPGDTDFGMVYTSDDRGVLYSKSLERHLFAASGKSDFTNVTSLRGVYLTNVLDQDGSIRSVITYDRGGEWNPLNKPADVKCASDSKRCSLHIHGEYSISNQLAPMLPLSDPSAVGLIIAHGSVGDSITAVKPDVYISDDGGYSWMKTLEGPHHYTLLDSGGLIVAVEYYTDIPIKTVKFSTDEGQCWQLYNFTDKPIIFAGLASEPGTRTMNISIWGYMPEAGYKATWVSVTIDFEQLLTRDCEDDDYVNWLAHSTDEGDIANDGCVLGYKETFRRLKKKSVCINGRDYIVEKEQNPCLCSKLDYMCDYGYYRQENSSECVEQPDFKDRQLEFCLLGNEELLMTTGYRKIPGDKCAGGFTPERTEEQVNKRCGTAEQIQTSKSKETTIVLAVSAVIMMIALVTGAFLIIRKLMSGVKNNVGRGLNLALVNGRTGELMDTKFYDMWGGDVKPLIEFLKTIQDGTVVLIATFDDGATKLNDEARKLLGELGSTSIATLGFRDNWIFVGGKGIKTKSPFEQVNDNCLKAIHAFRLSCTSWSFHLEVEIVPTPFTGFFPVNNQSATPTECHTFGL
ncbi:UNVERIFIED_CONTAM: hypothetical protein FKN15_058452 [Acipenser sinensis]